MNLTKAFIERNRLKKYISDLTDILNSTPVYHDKKLGERDWGLSKSIDAQIENIINAKQYLGILNTAIDKANAKEARVLLNKIESIKSSLATVSKVLETANNVQQKEISYNYDTQCVIERAVDVDVSKLNTTKKCFEKQIRDLEDKIAEVNSSTLLDIPEELGKFLGSYNN